MQVYIAGAITGTDDYENRFLKYEKFLIRMGHKPINPVKVCAHIKDGTHEQYMDACIRRLINADAIVMIPGWEKSEGASLEYRIAEAMGISLLELYPVGEKMFFFFFPKKKAERKYVDYEFLYNKLKEGPLTFNDIQELTGVSRYGVAQVITTLVLKYPVWSPQRGVYKLLEESDYENYK